MKNRSPHIAYIQDVEEYLSVIEERFQEAAKRAVYAKDQQAADDIAQMQELATDLHVQVFAFLTNLRTQPPFRSTPTPEHTPIGYEWRDLRTLQDTEELGDDEESENRITLIPEVD